MNHDNAINLLPAYIDKELSISETADFELHMESCSLCQEEFKAQSQISQLIKNNAPHYSASPQFSKNLNALLNQNESPSAIQRLWNSIKQPEWLYKNAFAVSLATIAFCVSFLFMPSAQDKLRDEIIASHVRSLEVDHLLDVVSTDQHTVKPWFNGKLNYAPPVLDFAHAGYPLDGGRLDYIGNETVAVMIYHNNKHPINLYVWPTDKSDSNIEINSYHGYQLAHWQMKGMTYWAVSDTEENKLNDFALNVYSALKK